MSELRTYWDTQPLLGGDCNDISTTNLCDSSRNRTSNCKDGWSNKYKVNIIGNYRVILWKDKMRFIDRCDLAFGISVDFLGSKRCLELYCRFSRYMCSHTYFFV